LGYILGDFLTKVTPIPGKILVWSAFEQYQTESYDDKAALPNGYFSNQKSQIWVNFGGP
jgi:hypothetical protein